MHALFDDLLFTMVCSLEFWRSRCEWVNSCKQICDVHVSDSFICLYLIVRLMEVFVGTKFVFFLRGNKLRIFLKQPQNNHGGDTAEI